MYLYEDQFSESHDYPRVDAPSKVLIIASTPRCGSHMLGHALHKTDSFGFPLEYANAANLTEWKRRLEIDDFQGIMAEIQRRRTSPNGVFGIKLHYPHIRQFGGFGNVVRCFPNAYYILLSRRDVLKQAVSLSIASQTGVWIAGQKAMNDNPQYDVDHIDGFLRDVILSNASWRYTLVANGCNYIEMDFDHVRHNLVQSIDNIAGFIGIEIDPSEIPLEPVTKKQADLRNEEWEKRFVSDFNISNELLRNTEPGIRKRIEGKIKRMVKRNIRFFAGMKRRLNAEQNAGTGMLPVRKKRGLDS